MQVYCDIMRRHVFCRPMTVSGKSKFAKITIFGKPVHLGVYLTPKGPFLSINRFKPEIWARHFRVSPQKSPDMPWQNRVYPRLFVVTRFCHGFYHLPDYVMGYNYVPESTLTEIFRSSKLLENIKCSRCSYLSY